MTDAEGNVTTFTYDAMDRVVTITDAKGYVISYEYDGNGNLVSKTDPDGYTTEYTYNALDLVTAINYNDDKEVSYRYNKTGDLVSMTDWLGTTTFELDLLHQLTAATDHAGKRVEYTYDGVGNQTSIAYPDGTKATYEYDLVQNQTKVTETDGSETTYAYDGMGRVTEMHYPNGWVEYFTYDKMGRLLSVDDTHPSEKPAKTQKHTYEYDANGNIVYEYMRGNGTGQAKNETLYTYDALNRLITAHDNYGNSTRNYTYDSLGNLTYETGLGSHNMDYRYNNLNQLVEQSDDGWKTYTASSYDARGNLVLEEYYKNKNTTNTIGQYFFDETNKMVRGINAAGEESIYSYNGLGALMENTWIIAQNGYGYHGVNAGTSDNESVNGQGNGNSSGNTAGNNGNGNVKKTSNVIKQFVVDFSSETYKPLMEHEVNGLDYRYVYSDKARLSVVVQGIENGSASLLDSRGELHAYYHCDYLGTTDYLTSAVDSRVISWTSYNEWGEITHNAVLNCGARELDLVKLYATHDFDAVLTQYYAKARFYDVDNRRFTAVDPILDPSQYDLSQYATDPMQLVQHLYVKDNAVNWIDPLGLCYFDAKGNWCHDNWEYIGGYVREDNPRNEMLMQGDTGYAVTALQMQLRDRGYLSNSDCDGIFGPKTLQAVTTFQQVHNLAPDGIVGSETWGELFNKKTIQKPAEQVEAKVPKIKTPKPEKITFTGARSQNWEAILYNNVIDRLDEIPTGIGSGQLNEQLQEIIYDEARKLRPEFATIYHTYKIYNRNDPDFIAIAPLFEDPLFNDPNAHTGQPWFDGDVFLAGFYAGALQGAIEWGYYSKHYCEGDTISTRTLDQMTPEEISKLSREQLKELTPDGWQFHEHNGYVHIKDQNNTIRIRIDPSTPSTYTHIHIYDANKNPLDILGNIVNKRDWGAHIPYND